MIPFEQALRIIETAVMPLSTESIPFTQALNRILAMNVIADTDLPPFHKAAMDGFACRKSDLENELEIIEEIPAGKVPVKTTGPNQCARIMTGAMVPRGADFILMKEYAMQTPSGKIRRSAGSDNENICYKGEDVRSGDIVLEQGICLFPSHLAVLASVGCTTPLVYKIPRIAVISTGNELVEPNQIPGEGKIRNSNGYQLTAQVGQMGLTSDYKGIIADDKKALHEKLAEAIKNYDVVLISGGVSVGDYDFIPGILNQLHTEILFHGMFVKPGKHLLVGKKGSCFVVGMPGNPVSSFVLFEILVKPLLKGLMGQTEHIRQFIMPIAESFVRKKNDLLLFIPVKFTETGSAQTLEYHGSAHIHAYSQANGIMEVPLGVNEIKKGELVHVRPL